MKVVPLIFAPLLVLMSAWQAHAEYPNPDRHHDFSGCGISKRIHSNNADCLEAGYTNSYPWYYFGFAKGKAWATNKCSSKGGLMVKVDRGQGAEDWTWFLHSKKKNSQTGTGRINGVYCCTDRSDDGLCED